MYVYIYIYILGYIYTYIHTLYVTYKSQNVCIKNQAIFFSKAIFRFLPNLERLNKFKSGN